LDFSWEIGYVKTQLQNLLKAAYDADFYFIGGNHEDRWPRYLAKHASQANLPDTSIDALLELKKYNVKYTPYKQTLKLGKLHLTHDTGRAGKHAVAQALDDYQANIVIGHIHRMGVVYGGDVRGNTHVGASFGWLGDVDQIDYMHLAKARKDWQLGFGIGYMETNGTVHLQGVPIVDYRCVLEGKLLALNKS
jgi:hypothetical protein